MTPAGSRIACAGCGRSIPPDVDPFGCPGRVPGDDIDHVLRRVLDLYAPDVAGELRTAFQATDMNPYLRYRPLLHTARAPGLTTERYVHLVERLDDAIAGVDGRGFRVTPFEPSAALGSSLGFPSDGLWIKDETGNVSGTHKGRHLMGILIWLEATRALADPEDTPPVRLAIASCGNAALAAAVLARAALHPLDVFVPPDACRAVLRRLVDLGAVLTTCPRDGAASGDPCVHAFRRALAGGACPFACQGDANGLTIDGGKTLAWEMISTLAGRELDRLFIQVGGGALASSCIQAFEEAQHLGVVRHLPRVHPVQTMGAHPLVRAYDRLAETIRVRADLGVPEATDPIERRAMLANAILAHADRALVEETVSSAARRRSAYMWPWESEPASVATAILDDETYDWLAVARGALLSGGYPLVASEDTLTEANRAARAHTGIRVSVTGSAGLAGCVELRGAGLVPPDESTAVIFTGIAR